MQTPCKLGKRGRAEPRHYGEVLTEDEIVERIRAEEESKKQKKEEKKAAKGKRKTKKRLPRLMKHQRC